jgi:enamine deaminase RidA (YjgF/YER057c/UK114 family)
VAGEIITTELAPRPDAPLSQAVRVGQLVFVSGLTPFTREIARAKGWLGWLRSPGDGGTR